MPPTSLPSLLTLLESDTLLKGLYDTPVEPGQQQRALLRRMVRHILDPEVLVTLAPGAAGTGKTTMIRVFLWMLLGAGLDVIVVTPTHKAKRRVVESLGEALCALIEVETHHRLWCGGAREEIEEGEEYADDLTLSVSEDRVHLYDVVVVDEASMLTVSDLAHLTQVVPHATIIGTGDHHQLPPVGGPAGFDWSDADDYGLTQVYRQAEGSPVLDAATAIREQRVPFTWSKVADWKAGGQILKDAGVRSRWAGSVEAGKGLATMIERNGGGLASAVAITGTHASRVRVADATRRALGLPPRREGPAIGERVIARASAGGLSNATQGTVVTATRQHFGARFGAGWVVEIDCEDGRTRTVGVLEQSWLQTDRAKNRGLIPYSVRQMLDAYVEEDMLEHQPALQGTIANRSAAYIKRHGDDAKVPSWLVDRWTAEACAERGAWAPWLAGRLAALDTGYAITCHASQGSQWQEIIVVGDCVDFIARDAETGIVDPDQVYRWSYTAITRAVETVTVVCKAKRAGDWGEPTPVAGVDIGTASRDWQARKRGRR